MARQKATGVFVVTPAQFDENDELQGISFTTASQASAFCTKLLKAIRTIAAKTKGLSKEQAKEFSASLGFDILMQQTDAEGNPVGNPATFDTVGLQ